MSQIIRLLPVRFLFISIFSTAFFVSGTSAAPVPPEVEEAALAGLASFLVDIPAGELANFGFAPSEDPLRSELGVPFPVYTITPEALLNYQEGETVSSLITSTGLWYFPVVLAGEMRSILTVAKLDGLWKAVALGRASLAGELQKVLTRWPRTAGYDPLIIKVFQAKEYLFTIPQVDAYNLSSFIFGEQGAEGGGNREGGGYSSLESVGRNAGRLRSAVAANMDQYQ